MDQENSPFFKKIQSAESPINSQTRQIILNVFFQLSSLNPERAFRDLADEVGMLTGVSGRTVSRLKAEENAILSAANQLQLQDESLANNNDDITSQASTSQNVDPISSNPVSKSIKKKSLTKNRKFQRYEESIIASVRRKSEEYATKKTGMNFMEFYGKISSDSDLPKFSKTELFRLMKSANIKWFNQRYVIPKSQLSPSNKAARMALKKAMRLNSNSNSK